MFTWAAATVDIPDKVYKMLSIFGPKWYHYRLPFKNKTLADLLREATDDEDFSVKERAIEKALYGYLEWFEIAPHTIQGQNAGLEKGITKAKIKWDKEQDDYEAHKFIVKLAMLLSHLRCAVQTWDDYTNKEEINYEASVCEDPSRTRYVLYNLARGHALQTGRNYITLEDVPIVVKTVLSTAHIDRVAIFSLLISMSGGKLTTAQIMKYLNKSKHPALKTMTEFKAIGLVDMDDVDIDVKVQKPGQEYTVKTTTKQITLKEEFNWFLTEEFDKLRDSFVATDNREYMDIDSDGKKSEEKKAEAEDVPATRAENSGGTHPNFHFWSVYDELERQELRDPPNRISGAKKTVSRKRLHQGLVSSGHFYQGDATQIIEDMVNTGRLVVVSFDTYTRGSQ